MKYFGTFQKICVLLFLVGLPSWSWAGAAITYHGRILDTQKRPVQNSSVLFRIRVYSPNPEKCLLYEEVRTINMTDSDGIFVIPIGDGQGVRTTSDPGLQIEKVFANNPSVTLDTVNTPKLVCNSGSSFTASLLSQRHLAVSFDDNSGVGEQALPLMDINFVPLAVSAYDAQNLAGTPANSVLRLTSGNATPLSPANFSELLNLLNGASSQYEKSGKLAGQNLPALSNGQVLGWSGGTWAAVTPMTSYTETDPSVKSFAKSDLPSCNAGEFLTPNGSGGFACSAVSGASGGTVTSVTAGTGLKNITSPGDPITSTGTLAVDVGTGANQIVQMGADTKLPVVDGSKLTNVVASGLSGTASINTSGSITSPQMSTQNLYIENALSSRVTITAPVSFTDYSWILPNVQGTSGQVLGMSATSGQLEWKTLSPSGVSSVTADAPVVIDSSAPSAPKVTLPKATAAVDGYLDKADFATFSSKQAAGSYLTTLQGDVASSNFSNGTVDVTVNKIKNVPVSAAPTLNGQVLRYESGNLVPNFISMLDLRSNVTGALALSSTCGTNQTLTFNSATDSLKCESISITKSQVSDLGTIGTLAAKSVIDLSTADVTNILPITNGGTGANSVAQGLVFAGPVSGTGAPSFRSLASTDLPASASYWQAATGGINFPSGNVGIGTTSPGFKLDVAGVVASTSGSEWSYRSFLDSTTTSTRNHFMSQRSRSGGAVQAGDNLGGLGMAGKYDSTNYAYGWNGGAEISAFASENWSTTNRGADLAFLTTPSASSAVAERMRITSAGNVGIGTASPGFSTVAGRAYLSIAGPSNAGVAEYVTGAADADGNAVGVIQFTDKNSTATNEKRVAAILGALDGTTANNRGGSLKFYTKANNTDTVGALAERLRIDQNGNVGIGTVNPNNLLSIENTTNTYSKVRFASTSTGGGYLTSTNAGQAVITGGAEWNGTIWVAQSTGASMMSASFGDTIFYGDTGLTPGDPFAATPRLTITSNGRVGIGTTTPQASLHLNPGIVGAGPATSGTTPSTGIVARLSNGGGATLDHGMLPGGTQWLQATHVADQSNGFPIVLNPNGGAVGIGLLNPTYQLQLSTDSAAKPGTSTWTVTSDERLKDIRAPFTRGLAAINGLKTIYFSYKHNNPLALPSDKEYVGIKAQDVLKSVPEAVSVDKQGYLHVTNDSIIWTAVNAIKELYGKFVEQDREIAALKAENEKLKAYLCGRDPEATFCR